MIVSMTLKNFRGHRDKTIHFGPGLNTLLGPNEIGKTTIKEAITFGFFGTDSLGNRSPDHLISFGEDAGGVIITTDKASFERIKRRGQTAHVSLIRNGVPPIKMNQTELSALLGITQEVFSSCFDEGYFFDLPQNKKLEVIGQIAKVDRKQLLQSLLPQITIPSKVKLENLRVDVQVIANERRVVQNQLAADQGALAQVEVQLKEFQGDIADLDLEATKKEIAELTAQVDLSDLYQSELSKYQAALARARENHEENQRLEAERKKIELELKALKPIEVSALNQIQDKIAALNREWAELDAEKIELPPTPTLVEIPEGTCPKCGQMVPPKLKESAARAREKAINEYNEKAREIQNRIQTKKERMEAVTKERYALDERFANARVAQATHDTAKSNLTKRLDSLQLREVRKPNPPTKPEGNEKEVRDRLSDLKAKFHAHQLFSQKREQLVKREEMFRLSVEQRVKVAEELKQLEVALLRMPELEVKQTLKMLATPGVLFQFADDEFIVTDEKRIPYQSLSRGRKKKVGLELCKTFQRLTPRAPHFYFIDDVELMDEYMSRIPKDEQVFIAKVDPSLSELRVVQN